MYMYDILFEILHMVSYAFIESCVVFWEVKI